MSGLLVTDFNFDLPPELIAQQPPPERGMSRMLVMDRTTGAVHDACFADFPSLLQPGDLLVLNDSRVIPARLYARRTLLRDHENPTGQIEVMLTEQVEPGALSAPHAPGAPSLRLPFGARVGKDAPHPATVSFWRALVRPGRKIAIGERLVFPAPTGEILLEAEVLERGQFGERLLRSRRLTTSSPSSTASATCRSRPTSAATTQQEDRERYQTVFSRERGSVAAPTAGLHFTPQTLEALAARGIEVASITLHVGLGTFAPLRVDRLEDVKLHRERYTLGTESADAVNRAIGKAAASSPSAPP